MKDLISPDHVVHCRGLHQARRTYGARGHSWAPHIVALAEATGSRGILDYGCGKGTLRDFLGERVTNYDPVTFPGEPEPADLVACINVLDQAEEDKLWDILHQLRSLTRRSAFIVIGLGGDQKWEASNPKWIKKPAEEWGEMLMETFGPKPPLLLLCGKPLWSLDAPGVESVRKTKFPRLLAVWAEYVSSTQLETLYSTRGT